MRDPDMVEMVEVVDRASAAFSAALFRPNCVFNQQLNFSKWPIYCDHSVTSADVRLRFGNGLRNPGTSCFKKKRKVTRVRRPGPCRCVGGSQIVTPEKPSHPPLSPPPCRIGTA